MNEKNCVGPLYEFYHALSHSTDVIGKRLGPSVFYGDTYQLYEHLHFTCGRVGSLVPSGSPAACAFGLEGDGKILIHGCKLCCEACNGGHDLYHGHAVDYRGCCEVCDCVHHVLVDVPVFRVCGCVVHSSIGVSCIVLKREALLPMGCGKKHLQMGEGFVARRPLFPLLIIHRKNTNVENDMLGVVDDLLGGVGHGAGVSVSN